MPNGTQAAVIGCLLVGALVPARGQFILVTKEIHSKQTSNADPVVDASAAYRIGVQADSFNGQTPLASSTATVPFGSTGTIVFGTVDDRIEFDAEFDSLSELNSAFGNGEYTLNLTMDVLPNYAVTIDTTGGAFSSATPKILTVNGEAPTWFGGQLLLDPTIENTIAWSSFPEFVPNATPVIFNLHANDGPLNVNLVSFESNQLSGYIIAAGTLQSGDLYSMSVQFVRPVDFTSDDPVAGVTSTGAFGTITSLGIVTAIPEAEEWIVVAGLLALAIAVRRRQ